MTFHFVNLVSWRFFLDKNLTNSRLYCDSQTLKILLGLFGVRINQVSGVEYSNKIMNVESLGLLVAEDSELEHSYRLPYWSKLDNVCLSDEIIEFVNKYNYIAIGISSPKQDKLSFLLNERFGDKNIYCLGAALGNIGGIRKMSRFGLMWFGFLIKEPKRTYGKLKVTMKNFFEILFVNTARKDFKKFSKKISINFEDREM